MQTQLCKEMFVIIVSHAVAGQIFFGFMARGPIIVVVIYCKTDLLLPFTVCFRDNLR